MRIFFAGATGVIGRRLLPLLVDAGHDVTAMTRSEAKGAALRDAGATPVVCDAFDASGLRSAVAEARPEVVVHQLTDLPSAMNPRRMEEAYARNDRIRREGTRNLVDAATAAGARRVIAQSIAFAYAPSGSTVVSEDHPLYRDGPPPWGGAVAAVEELERLVLEVDSDRPDGVVLRYGFFYGPGSAYAADGNIADQVRRRRFPVVGGGGGVFSFIHVDDAAQATVAALDRGAPGAYNVADDDPAPMSEWLPSYAEALGAKRPLRVPTLLGRLAAGRLAVMFATELRGASNERARREFGWEPWHPSWGTGFRDALG